MVALTHKTGCGMAGEGEGMDVLRRTLGGYARHPNFAAVFMVGLGCESNQIGPVLRSQKLQVGDRAAHLHHPGERAAPARASSAGIALVREMLPDANRVSRQPVPASHLTIGLQCGGSDGYSGITANPALGAASDLLVRHGGTVILSETPETFGAEHLLTRRAVSREVGEKLLALFEWWKEYARKHGGTLDDNPSAGNKAGGITTILEKSLGAAAKAGATNLVDVYRYAEPVARPGVRVHGHARLRPGLGHRPGGGRGQPHLLHHRARLGVRLRALAFDQARHQQLPLCAHGRGHGRQLRHHHRRQRVGAGLRPADLRPHPAGRLGRTIARARPWASARPSSRPGRSAP